GDRRARVAHARGRAPRPARRPHRPGPPRRGSRRLTPRGRVGRDGDLAPSASRDAARLPHVRSGGTDRSDRGTTMGFYGADIGELRRLAQSLTTATGALESTRRALDTTVSGARWAGPDGDELRGRWTTELGPALTAAAATLRDAADAVRRNADQQESASTDGTGGPGGGPGSAGGPGSGGTGPGGSGSPGAGGGGPGGSGSGGTGGDDGGGTPGGPTVTVKGDRTAGTDDSSLGRPATEGTDAKVGVGVSHDPEAGSTTVSGTGSLKDWFTASNGAKVSFGVTGGAAYTEGEKTADGFTTYTSKADVSI